MAKCAPMGFEGGQAVYEVLAPVAGLASILLGLTVIVGWYMGSVLLTQVVPTFAPMQYNTALGFVLGGISLVALSREKIILGRVFGGLAGLLGLVTLSQYVFGYDLGLDNFFMQHDVTTKALYVGRMSTGTSFTFTLFGLAVFFYTYRKVLGSFDLVGEFMGMGVVVMAVLAYLSYLFHFDVATAWKDLTGMAIHTTTGFFILGLGFLFNIWREKRERVATVPLWVPVILLFGVMVFDLLSPLGVAAGVAYVPLVFCSLWFRGRYVVYTFAFTASALVVFGYLASPDFGVDNTRVLINRGLSLLAVWITALAVFIQKRTAENLAESQRDLEGRSEYQQAIMDTMVDSLLVIDEKGIIVSANQATKKLFGFSSEEMIGNNVKILMQGEERRQHDEYLKRYITTRDPHIIGIGPREVRGFTKDGEPLELELAVNESLMGGERIFVGSLRDLTEKKRILEESNAELEKFAYVASHDLRAPLRAIDNLSQWIEEDLQDVLQGETKKNMELMRGRVNRLEKLLDDILQYSRAGRIAEKSVRVDVNEVIKDLSGFLDVPEGMSIKIEGKLPKVIAPKGALDQVFGNLITNALKHHDKEKGTVTVSAREKGDFWEFSVADDGPGIPPEFHEKIFGMFQKLEGRDKAEGSGMGLAIIKKLITTQGGKVGIKSEAGERGATFYFTWPKMSPDRAKPSAE